MDRSKSSSRSSSRKSYTAAQGPAFPPTCSKKMACASFTRLFNRHVKQPGFTPSYASSTKGCSNGVLFRKCLHNVHLLQYYLEHPEIIYPLFSEYSHSQNTEIRRDVLLSIQDLLLGHPEYGELPYAQIALTGFPLLLSTPFVDAQIEGLHILYNYLMLPTTATRLFLDSIPLISSVFALLQSQSVKVVVNAYYVMKQFIVAPSKKAMRLYLIANRNQIATLLLSIPCHESDTEFSHERQRILNALQKMK